MRYSVFFCPCYVRVAARAWASFLLTGGLRLAAAAPEAAVPQATLRTGEVTANILNVRARPGLAYELLCKLNRGEEVVIREQGDDWLGIVPPGNARAFVSAEFISPQHVVSGDKLRVRSGPGVRYSPYGLLERGESVTPIGPAEDGWLPIEPPAHATAWVSRAFVHLHPAPEPVTVEVLPATDSDAEPTGDTVAAHEALESTEGNHNTEPDTPARQDGESPEDGTAPANDDPPDEDAAPVDLAALAAARPAVADRTDANPEYISNVLTPTQVPEIGGAPARTGSGRVMVRGVLMSLGERASTVASHVLLRGAGQQVEPVCYVRSDNIRLAEWEGRTVTVYGTQDKRVQWSRPVYELNGVLAR